MEKQEIIPTKDVLETLINVLHLDSSKRYQSLKIEVSINGPCFIEAKTIATWK